MKMPKPFRFLGRAALAALAALASAAPQTATAFERVNYVLFAPGSESTSMSGSMDDMRRARALRHGTEPLLYVRTGGVSYVVRDAATLNEARAIMKPQQDLGERQGELGRRQGELGRRQGELGAEQGRLGAMQANATPKQAAELAKQQGELGRRQGELGAQQGELGRQQGLLGQEQARLAKIASAKLEALIAQAVRQGKATRVD
jgi:hypothetical protein